MIQESMGSSSDRLLVAILLAGVVHAGVIFGIRLHTPAMPKIDRTLDVELIEQPDANQPPKAAYRAQANSAGGGMYRANPKPVAFPPRPKLKSQDRPAPRLTQAQASANLPASQAEVITEPHLDRELLARQVAELVPAHAMNFDLSERVMPIRKINAYKHIAAAYERAWQEKVERIGNLNYPDEARRQSLSGAVLVSVWVAKDGQVKKIQVHRSSGRRVLDEAVLRIVRLAAPFSPFPVELANQADEIVITRTWKFYDEAGLAMDH